MIGKDNNLFHHHVAENSETNLNNNDLLSPFAKRLKQIIGKQSLTIFAQQCDLSESAIRKYIRGDSEPTLQNLRRIAKVAGVPLSWLAADDEEELSNISFTQARELQLNNYQNNNNLVVIPEIDFHTLYHEPKLGVKRLSMTIDKQWFQKAGLNLNHVAITVIKCNGLRGVVNDSDIALININPEGWNKILEGIFIISLNDFLMVKRIQFDPTENCYRLYSDNPLYKDYLISPESEINFKILAKVEFVFHKAV